MELLWQLQGVYISYKSLNNFHLYAIQLQQITTSADSYMNFTNNKTYQVYLPFSICQWSSPLFYALFTLQLLVISMM